MDIWERIQRLIVSNRTTQEAVARSIKVSPRTFRGWLNRKIMPNADQAVRISRELYTSVEYLVEGAEGEEYLQALMGTSPIRDDLRDLFRMLEELPRETIDLICPMVGAAYTQYKAESKHA